MKLETAITKVNNKLVAWIGLPEDHKLWSAPKGGSMSNKASRFDSVLGRGVIDNVSYLNPVNQKEDGKMWIGADVDDTSEAKAILKGATKRLT